MLVTTGYGYIKDASDHIISKYELPKGEHPSKEGYTYYEVATKAEMDAIEIYVTPVDPAVAFNVNVFLVGIMTAFNPLENYGDIEALYPMISDFARAKDFERMKAFLQARITAGRITQAHYDLLNNVLKQQNIDLDAL